MLQQTAISQSWSPKSITLESVVGKFKVTFQKHAIYLKYNYNLVEVLHFL